VQFAIVFLLAILLYLYYSTVYRKPAVSKKDNVIDIESLKKENSHEGPLPYKKRRALLTRQERKLYADLLEGVEGLNVTVLLKVSLRELLYLPPGTENQAFHLGGINGRQVDFLLVNSGTLEPLLALVLQDEAGSGKADLFLQQACQDAGLSFLLLAADEGRVEDLSSLIIPLLRSDQMF
jgi:hypothetical protein